MKKLWLILILVLGCVWMWSTLSSTPESTTRQSAPSTENLEKAAFAGGCFWCMEPPFEKLPGVASVISGYMGGKEKNPTYEQVSMGATGHREAVVVSYDSSQVKYAQLLDAFWRSINPTQANGQFADIGPQYKTAIFYYNDKQKELAEASKKALAESGKFDKPIVTEILPASEFWIAEEYHQDYYKKNPVRYQMYKVGSGREGFLKKTWGS